MSEIFHGTLRGLGVDDYVVHVELYKEEALFLWGNMSMSECLGGS